MAGVNNPQNFKPLIDAQSAEQALDFSWLKSIAAGNKLKLEKANTDLAAVHESVNSSSAATQNAIAQSVIDNGSTTNAARDLINGQLTQLAVEVESLKTELQNVKALNDFDVNLITGLTGLNSSGVLPVMSSFMPESAVFSTLYSRVGKGVIKSIEVVHSGAFELWADGVRVVEGTGTGLKVGEGVGIPYVKYFQSIEIKTKSITTYGYSKLKYADWKIS